MGRLRYDMQAHPAQNVPARILALCVLALGGLCAVAYWPVLSNDFVAWDTPAYVIYNEHVHSLSAQNLWWMLTSLNADLSYWHPLTWLSHALDYAVYGLNPAGHHLSNLLLHCANTLWLLLTALLLTPTPVDRQKLLAALLAAALFAVHPLHVEVVAWVAERKELLCTFFLFPTVLAYLAYARAVRRRALWYGLGLLCYALALGSKPMAVTLPAVLLLLDFYPLGRLQNRPPWGRILLEKLPFAAMSGATIVLTLLAQRAGSISDLAFLDLSLRVLNAFHTLVFYLQKLLLPLYLLPFYPFPQEQSLWPVALTLLIFALAIWLWRRGQPVWLTAWLFYLVTLAPVIGVVQSGLQAAADRYTYLPTIPFFLLAGAGGQRLLSLPGRAPRMAALSVVGLVLLALGGLTRHQSNLWYDSVSLWGYTVRYVPDSAEAHANLAAGLIHRGAVDRGVAQLERAVALQASEQNYLKLAVAYRLAGEADKRRQIYEGLADFHRRQGHPAKAAQMWGYIAELELDRQRPAAARQALQQVLRYAPEDVSAKASLAALPAPRVDPSPDLTR
jgi:tetratricopeptide (TPR) repeat protein